MTIQGASNTRFPLHLISRFTSQRQCIPPVIAQVRPGYPQIIPWLAWFAHSETSSGGSIKIHCRSKKCICYDIRWYSMIRIYIYTIDIDICKKYNYIRFYDYLICPATHGYIFCLWSSEVPEPGEAQQSAAGVPSTAIILGFPGSWGYPKNAEWFNS